MLTNRLAILATVWGDLAKRDAEFTGRFPFNIPYTNRPPTDVYKYFRLEDPDKLVGCWSHSCPNKYKGRLASALGHSICVRVELSANLPVNTVPLRPRSQRQTHLCCHGGSTITDTCARFFFLSLKHSARSSSPS